MSNIEINKQIAKGAIWMVGLRLCIKGISIVSTMILARLLMPEDFGVMAMASSVYALIELMRAFGFDTVLIQKQTADRDHYDTAWTLQVIFALLSSASIIAISNVAANYYNDPRIAPALSMLAIITLLNGFCNIGVVEFRKQLTFNKEFTYQLLVKMSGFLVTIPLAFYLRSYWALLMGMLSSNIASLLLSYIMQSYRPRVSLKVWRDVLGFSSWLFVNNILFFLNQHAQNFILGKMGGSGALGLLTISNEIAMMVTGEIVAPINRAAFPGYSAVAHDKEKLKKTYLEVVSYIAMLVCPSAIGIAAIAPVFVPVLLGDKWLNTVVIIQIIALSSVMSALSTNAGYIYLALKKQNITTALMIFYLSFFLPLMFFLLKQQSVLGVAKAILFSGFIMFPVNQIISKIYLKFSWADYISTICRPFLAACIMGCLVYFSALNINIKTTYVGVLWLIYLVIMGIVIFCLSIALLWIISGKPYGIESELFKKIKTRVYI